MLPSRRPGDSHFSTGQKIILPRFLVEVRRHEGLAVEVPLRLHASAAVRMARVEPEQRILGQRKAEIRPLERV